MKKIILIIFGIVAIVILGRLGWAYFQVKTDVSKEANTSTTSEIDSIPTNPEPPALPN